MTKSRSLPQLLLSALAHIWPLCGISVDIGGTKVRVYVVVPKEKCPEALTGHTAQHVTDIYGVEYLLFELGEEETPVRAKNPDEFIYGIYRIIVTLLEKHGLVLANFHSVNFFTPGPMDPWKGIIYNPPNIPCLKAASETPFRDIIKREFFPDKIITIGRDTPLTGEAAALEHAPGVKFVLYNTVSTGDGPALIIDGEPQFGYTGMLAEAAAYPTHDFPSYCILGSDARCNTWKSVENFSSGSGIVRRYKNETGIETTCKDVFERYKDGDSAAIDVVETAANALAYGLAMWLHFYNPEVVIFGGSVAVKQRDILMPLVLNEYPKHLLNPHMMPREIIFLKESKHYEMLGAFFGVFHPEFHG